MYVVVQSVGGGRERGVRSCTVGRRRERGVCSCTVGRRGERGVRSCTVGCSSETKYSAGAVLMFLFARSQLH